MSSEPWYQKACEKMVREDKSLFVVSNELDLGLTARECEELKRNKDFAATLRGERFKYYKEIANDPNRSKIAAVGNLLVCIQQLMDKGQEDKAANAIVQLSKLEGWLDSKTEVNIFGDLTAKDLADMRSKIQKAAVAIN